MAGFHVDPAALRTAAGQLRTAGGPLYAAAGETTGAIGAAVGMNMGYETARALSSFGSAVRQAAKRVQERLDEHVDAFQTTAKHYEDGDAQTESRFKTFLTV
jgi:uncharacterized protein YukE